MSSLAGSEQEPPLRELGCGGQREDRDVMGIRTREMKEGEEQQHLEAFDTTRGSRTFTHFSRTRERSPYWNRALLSNDPFCLDGTLAAQGRQLVVETQNTALLHVSADM